MECMMKSIGGCGPNVPWLYDIRIMATDQDKQSDYAQLCYFHVLPFLHEHMKSVLRQHLANVQIAKTLSSVGGDGQAFLESVRDDLERRA